MQLMKARRPSQSTSRPSNIEMFKVLRVAASGSEFLKKIFDAVAKQEFVAENLLVRGKNRLAGDKLSPGLGHRFAFTETE